MSADASDRQGSELFPARPEACAEERGSMGVGGYKQLHMLQVHDHHVRWLMRLPSGSAA